MSIIVGIDAAFVAIYFDCSDRAVLCICVQVTFCLCLILGVFDIPDTKPTDTREHTHDVHDAA